MSADLEKALDFANYRATLNNQQALIRAKAENLLNYSVNGGTFVINRELITFCKLLLDRGEKESILLDVFDNPIKIDLEDFFEEILSRYFEVTNDYYADYEKVRRARKVSRVVDIND